MVSSIISEHTIRHLKSSNQYNFYSQRLCKIFPLTIDATPLNYNSFLPDRRQNNSLNSTLVPEKNLNGTRNLTQQDVQTPSHFINEEIVERIVTTIQQSNSPIHPNLYQTFRPMTKPP